LSEDDNKYWNKICTSTNIDFVKNQDQETRVNSLIDWIKETKAVQNLELK
jgi:hypothetical protein